jgi:cytochrome c oxidase subunit 1
MKTQLWLWFIGMLVLSMPWHWVGLLGMPRRMAYYDYTHPALQPQAWTVTVSTLGGLMLVVSAFLFVFILAAARKGATAPERFTFSVAAHPGGRAPVALNGFGLWVAMMIGLTVVNYGYPIVQLALLDAASVPIVPIGSR